jgi:FMN phosphatase YigB (HAD superfamily)
MRYKVVFVDWDGTLSDSRFWGRWAGASRYEQIQEVLFRGGHDLLKDWMRGLIKYEAILQYAEAKTGIPYKDLEDELRYSSENMKYINPSVIEKVQKLRATGVKVVIATDNMDVFRHWTVPALQLDTLFDGILVSDSRSALKVDFHSDGTSKFFDHYFSQSSAMPSEMVLLDDSLDAKAVERTGVHFLHVNDAITLSDHLSSILT